MNEVLSLKILVIKSLLLNISPNSLYEMLFLYLFENTSWRLSIKLISGLLEDFSKYSTQN